MRSDIKVITKDSLETVAKIVIMQIKRGLYLNFDYPKYEDKPPNKKGGGFVTSKTSTRSK